MQCQSCGTEINGNAQFCPVCGQPMQPQPMQPQPMQPQPMQPSVNSMFVDPNEVPMATLSNGAFSNIASGEGFKREKAIVTNKRLYYKHKHGIINIVDVEEKIDLRDITATKIVDSKRLIFLILAGLSLLVSLIIAILNGAIAVLLVGLLAAALFTVLYFVTHKKRMRIEYAGGAISFSLIRYQMENIRSFQNTIYQLKDQMNGR